ncbi:flagellar hook protein FlgE [Rhodospirillum rubrum]|nr:flagellar hook protein FlgE [Rhodospirillum rubrum]MBK5954975.1 flagellar hook protein FlgE [Rhodospirillum rubrum]QXG79305.1 flagellar hook protein FlgE [Rhodospirillum rubrum]HAQ01274.1 flagellar hook protein FlgE [Rhodospirillum rubrum]HCF18800.1 flagellar hook protein FlgE [Rhodospirillum rubrum]
MSSLSSSLNVAVSAMNAQSSSVSAISNNLANSSTIGYKTSNASFYSLVTGTGSTSNFTGAGVVASATQNVINQGVIVGTQNVTDLAVDGKGMFIVTDRSGSNELYYTRAGDFYPNADGDLVNSNNYYLQGYPTDRNGVPLTNTGNSGASLETINLAGATGAAKATSEMSIQAVLPAQATAGDSTAVPPVAAYTSSSDVEIYDSLGVAHTMTVKWTKMSDTKWTMTLYDPKLSSDMTGDATGAISSTTTGVTDVPANAGPPATSHGIAVDVEFTDQGLLKTPSVLALKITPDASNGTGAAISEIALNLGTAGKANGLSTYSNEDSDGKPAVDLKKVVQDGVTYGTYYSNTISKAGLVYANFTNGISYPIYQVPLAMFSNVNGLEAVSGTAYSATVKSGTPTYVTAGTGGSGGVSSGSVESSTVDTAAEFSKLIVSQQAYSAATQIISSNQEMFQNLISAKR